MLNPRRKACVVEQGVRQLTSSYGLGTIMHCVFLSTAYTYTVSHTHRHSQRLLISLCHVNLCNTPATLLPMTATPYGHGEVYYFSYKYKHQIMCLN